MECSLHVEKVITLQICSWWVLGRYKHNVNWSCIQAALDLLRLMPCHDLVRAYLARALPSWYDIMPNIRVKSVHEYIFVFHEFIVHLLNTAGAPHWYWHFLFSKVLFLFFLLVDSCYEHMIWHFRVFCTPLWLGKVVSLLFKMQYANMWSDTWSYCLAA